MKAIIKGDTPFYCDSYKSKRFKLVRPGQVVFVSHSILSRFPPYGRQEGGLYCCELPADRVKIELYEDDIEFQERQK